MNQSTETQAASISGAALSPAAPVRLTAYSHGAGCGCKISPAVLDAILPEGPHAFQDARLLVGNQMRDDAAVWQIDETQSLIATTDFFMPIVDDPFDFGRVAAGNGISDVYAMGESRYWHWRSWAGR